MPTPDIYTRGIMQPFAETLPAELKSVDVNIMYATDRVQTPREDGRLDYGMGNDSVIQYAGQTGRSRSHNYFRTIPAVASDLVNG